jgi:hypothetical protein
MRFTVRFAVAAALLAFPSLAAAGPIQWDYRANVTGEDGGPYFYLGLHARPDSEEPGGIRTGDILGRPRTDNPSGSASGSQSIPIATLSDINVVWNDVPFQRGPTPDHFRVDFTITDRASGESGTVTAYGAGEIQSDPMLFDFVLWWHVFEWSDQELTLGGNRYQIHFTTPPELGDAPTLSADVTVGPAAATPEPGTFALAGLGLGAVFARRRLRVYPGS